jgi:hypothetical protein
MEEEDSGVVETFSLDSFRILHSVFRIPDGGLGKLYCPLVSSCQEMNNG